MSELVLRLVNISLVIIEFIVFIVLLSGFFSLRCKRYAAVLVFIIIFITNYIVIKVFASQMVIKLFISCILLTLLAQFLYRSKLIYCAVLSLLYLSFSFVTDALLLFFAATVGHMNSAQLIETPYRYYLMAFSAKILEVLIVTILHVYAKSRTLPKASSPQDYLRIVAFPFVSLLSTLVLLGAFFKFPNAAPYFLLCVVLLLFFDLAAILLLSHFERQQKLLMDSRILQQELKLAQDSVAMLSASYANERRLTHDFQNKLLTIQGLLNHDKGRNEIQAYINTLVKQEYTPSLSLSTQRSVADVILNLKYQTAQQNQITISLQLDNLATFPLPDDALVVVLANLLDNAIEACKKVPDPAKRKLVIKAKITAGESILYLENTVSHPVKIANNRIATTKADSSQHGYGLQNVFSLVEAHGGTATIHYEDYCFSCVIFFPKQ